MDLGKQQFSIDVAGRPFTVEISRLAEQASAAVLGRYGETAVLTTVVMTKEDKDIDYFPLTVNYEERFYAAGKFWEADLCGEKHGRQKTQCSWAV